MYFSPYPPGCTAKDIDDAYGPDEEDIEDDEPPEDFEEDYTDLQNMLAYG